ncbi:helix-turn-helix domain-containing protein [uncultured Dialister sp.]|uniref:winged helix-turn-helix transcriptional regulator n=1 Tax=uncultured Dialister sp. TaxID=278064 RepID=UPI0025CE8ED0|nr:helix-turn-helix domain-containing protein [uncultured Dialister sp.]
MENSLFGVCPFVTAQKLLQGKWAILILHALSEGTKRFNELERDIQITHATLSSQLKYMEKEGLVHRTVYPEVPPRVEYSLTAMGRRFAPVLDSIQVWGEEYIEFLKENRI